ALALHCARRPLRLPSFPTRRSSDLSALRRRHPVLMQTPLDFQPQADREIAMDAGDSPDITFLLNAGQVKGGGLASEEALPLIYEDRKSTRLNSSHDQISYAVFCLKK